MENPADSATSETTPEGFKKPVETEKVKTEVDASTSSAQEESQPTSSTPSPVLKPKLDSSQVIKDKPKNKTSLLSQFNSWILPIVALLVLAIVSVTVLIPSANDTMATLDEIRSVEQQIEKYDRKLEQLSAIRIAEVNSSLQIASQVIKDDLEVASLASDVELLAKNQNLETKSVTFSSSSSSLLNVPGYVNTISGPFSYSGTFKDLSDFIEDLRTKSPTIVALREVTMSRAGIATTEEEATWTANFMIDAFTTSKVTTVSLQDVVTSTVNADLMDEISNRLEYKESLD